MPPRHRLLFLEDFYAETEMTHDKVTSVCLIRETVPSELENTCLLQSDCEIEEGRSKRGTIKESINIRILGICKCLMAISVCRMVLFLKQNYFWLRWLFSGVHKLLFLVVALEYMGSVVAMLRLSCPLSCGILVPWPGMEPVSPTLQGRFSITGPPEKSPGRYFWRRVLFKPEWGKDWTTGR